MLELIFAWSRFIEERKDVIGMTAILNLGAFASVVYALMAAGCQL